MKAFKLIGKKEASEINISIRQDTSSKYIIGVHDIYIALKAFKLIGKNL